MDKLTKLALLFVLANKNNFKHLHDLLDVSILDITSGSFDTRINKLNVNLDELAIKSFVNNLQKHNIKFVTIFDSLYPALLKVCPDAPLVLFYVGNSKLLSEKMLLSIVGTRTITNYGKTILEELVPNLKKHTIVSGMAFGVDAYAHKLAIDNSIQTIAVLPNSCHFPTPKGNASLYKRILDSGNLVISDHPPSGLTHAGLFPRRNRIIAGVSPKTIVIEAGIKSGALITADLAFNYSREVYAYPGNINQYVSKGCNYLIKNNIAQLIESSDDFLGILKPADKSENLSEIERKIYYAILREPKSISELSTLFQVSVQELSAICTKLQINGILNTDNQNKFYTS